MKKLIILWVICIVRSPLYSGEIYNYYKYPYNEHSDISKIHKRWDHLKGGASTLKPRIRYKIRFFRECSRTWGIDYRNNTQFFKASSYVIGVKGNANSLDLKTETGKNIVPWSYDQSKVLSLSHHRKFVKYSFQKAERKGPE